jgi:hypothetical protein
VSAFELLELQRAVVHRCGQAETVFHQIDLAAAVATVHRPDLRHAHMALVNEHQEIVREIVQQAERPRTCLPSVKIAAVVLNARAVAQFAHHLQVILRALLQAFGLQGFSYGVEVVHLFHHVLLDLPDGGRKRVAARDEVVGRIDHHVLQHSDRGARIGVYPLQFLNLISEEEDAVGIVGIGQPHIDHIAFHPELPAFQRHRAARIERRHQLMQQQLATYLLPHLQLDDILLEIRWVADAIDARHRCHHQHIPAARKQRGGRAKAVLLDLIVYCEVLLYVGVRSGDVGLRLIVVVVGDVILHRVVGEELAHLAKELCGQGLVVAQHQRGAVQLRHHIGHGEGLARTRYAQQHLMPVATLNALHQLADGLGLIACGLEF